MERDLDNFMGPVARCVAARWGLGATFFATRRLEIDSRDPLLRVSGRGHSATVERALRRDDALVLLCGRASELFYVLERSDLPEEKMIAAIELPADAAAVYGFVEALERSCQAARNPLRTRQLAGP